MSAARSLAISVTLLAIVVTIMYLLVPQRDAAQSWEQRKARFEAAAQRAGPLIDAIAAYTAARGRPPDRLDDLLPDYLERLPDTGLAGCSRFEYRSLVHRQGTIVWYDLGSRQGQPLAKPGHYSDGDPDHAILVFSLDRTGQITGALIDRLPKDREPEDFDPERWKTAQDRIGMALALSETYRLHGMPRDVFESLLGPPDGERAVRGAPWELRINCPTGLLNHDAFIYWPGGHYPAHLYGGTTELIGQWVYVHS